MSLQDLIDQARKNRSPEEQAKLDEQRNERMRLFNIKAKQEWDDGLVTEELLNKVINL